MAADLARTSTNPRRRRRSAGGNLRTPVLLVTTVAIAVGLNLAVLDLSDDAAVEATAAELLAEAVATTQVTTPPPPTTLVVQVDVTVPLASVMAEGADARGGQYDFAGFSFDAVAPVIVLARHLDDTPPRLELWSVELESGWTYQVEPTAPNEVRLSFGSAAGRSAAFTAILEDGDIVVSKATA